MERTRTKVCCESCGVGVLSAILARFQSGAVYRPLSH